MIEPREITRLAVRSELRSCPACGYGLGFHVSFEAAGKGTEPAVRTTRESFRAILICPECGARYDVGWLVSFDGHGAGVKTVPIGTGGCMPHGSPALCLPEQPLSREDKDPDAPQ